MRPYSEAVKADVRRRMRAQNRQSVVAIARELGITLSKWRVSLETPGGGGARQRERAGGPLVKGSCLPENSQRWRGSIKLVTVTR